LTSDHHLSNLPPKLGSEPQLRGRERSGVRYTFGDGDLAAQRLALVASVYEDSSRALLASAVPAGCDTVVDLGCGPVRWVMRQVVVGPG
jgi:hypothetical protein